jgi:hypothetical protein
MKMASTFGGGSEEIDTIYNVLALQDTIWNVKTSDGCHFFVRFHFYIDRNGWAKLSTSCVLCFCSVPFLVVP